MTASQPVTALTVLGAISQAYPLTPTESLRLQLIQASDSPIVSAGLIEWSETEESYDRFTTQLRHPDLTRYPDDSPSLFELQEFINGMELAELDNQGSLPVQGFYYITVSGDGLASLINFSVFTRRA